MKNILPTLIAAVILSTSLSTYAQTSDVVAATVTVRANPIVCVTRLNGDTFTQVGDIGNLIFSVEPEGILELTHSKAFSEGCDFEKLNRIANNAGGGFGFLYNRPATIEKEVFGRSRDSAGRCSARLKETLTVDLGEGILVRSTVVRGATETPCS